MIKVENVSYSYDEVMTLDNINISIEPKEFIFIKGSSGSGKTSLFKLFYKEISGYTGTISINNLEVSETPAHLIRRNYGIIFQSYKLLQDKTALENVELAGRILGLKKDEIKLRSKELLVKVGLEDKMHRFPFQLSGGEQQRVSIARALLNNPSILLADEPTGNLDPENAENIIDLIKSIHDEYDITTLVITHSNEITNRFPCRTIELNNGKVERNE